MTFYEEAKDFGRNLRSFAFCAITWMAVLFAIAAAWAALGFHVRESFDPIGDGFLVFGALCFYEGFFRREKSPQEHSGAAKRSTPISGA